MNFLKKIVAVGVVSFAPVYLSSQTAFSQEYLKSFAGIACVFTPDGKYIASGSEDNTTKLWEVSTGQCIHTFTGHTEDVNTVAFSPDGKFIASGSDDNTIKLWDLSTGQCIRTFTGHVEGVNTLIFSSDGKYIASGSNDSTIKLWEVSTGQCIKTFIGYSRSVNSVAFSPDGKFIASGNDDNTIKLWDVFTGRCTHIFTEHFNAVNSVAFSPDGKYIVSGSSDKTVKLWEMSTGQCIHTFIGHSDVVESVAFSPDGKFIASGSWDSSTKLWNRNTGQCICTLTGDSFFVKSVAFSADGKYIATGYSDETIKLWDINGYIITPSSAPPLIALPKPTAPANLVISDITYKDNKNNNNNVLDAGEHSEIEFKLSNTGKGDAYNVIVKCEETNGLKGISIENKTIGTIKSGEAKEISIAINSTLELITSQTNFKIEATEGNGFNANPVEVQLLTQEFLAPKVVIADYKFSNEHGGQIKAGVPVNLKVIVQNIGQGEAKNVELNFTIPHNVFATDKQDFNIGNLATGDKKELNFEFFSNKQYNGNTIIVDAVLKEHFNRYAENKTMSVELNKVVPPTEKVVTTGELYSAKAPELASLTSDVDKNIPYNNKTAQKRFALIIGNEDYSAFQTGLSSEANVEFARNDATVFKQYCEKTLGIPEENITCLTDATVGKMRQGLDKMNKLMKNSDGKLEIIFYYAGHGLPDENTHEPYLIPVDVNGNNLQSAIKLSDVYQQLTQYPAERVSVFFDACFSGGARNKELVAARTVKVTPKTDMLTGNIIVFSASSSEQTSMSYSKKQHGLFTYFLLKKLQETKGELSYKELANYLENTVGLESVKINSKEQNPQTNVSNDIKDIWGKWQLLQ